MWHIVTTFWFSVCVFCWLMTCALSIFSVLDNFCQISPLHSNAVWITRVLHLICNAHTHILLFGSKFHIILAMYVQMLDIYIENIRYFRYFRKYHDIFQPWGKVKKVNWAYSSLQAGLPSPLRELILRYGITQCYLPPCRGDIPAFTPAEAVG